MKNYYFILVTLILLFVSNASFSQRGYKLVVDYQFDELRDCSDNGLIVAKKNDKYGCIDQYGKVVIDFVYDIFGQFSKGMVRVTKDNGNTFYIDQNGKFVFTSKIPICRFSPNGLGVFYQDSKWGYIDINERVVITPQFENANDFVNGLASVKNYEKWGFVDPKGKLVFDFQFDEVTDFTINGVALAKKNGQWGIIDKTGKTLVDFQYDDANGISDNGIAVVAKGDKYGYIDKNGRVVIDFQFNYANPFVNGLAMVVDKNEKCGNINENGKLVVGYQFEYINNFGDNGLAPVQKDKDGKFGYIDKTGRLAIDYQFDDANCFIKCGLAAVKLNDKWGLIRPSTPMEEIETYVKTEIEKWQQKGKFETIEEYKARVSEEKRAKKVETLMNAAIKSMASTHCNWKSATNEYDPDNQTFKINIQGLSPFYLKVPIAEAKSFDASFSKMQYTNPVYSLGSDGTFGVQKVTVKNPINGKVYSYSSTDKTTFAVTQLNLNFEPLQLSAKTSENSENVKSETKSITVGQSDVDVNIPINPQTNSNTFVVIIANENYQKEVKVKFAINDGRVFKEYCEKTLGVPSKNIHFVPDATFGNIKSEIKWISEVISAYGGQAKVIFYYAGHGMPNEADKSAYLIPVDGFSSDFETAIKLNDLYSRLTSNSSQSVTFILDACFSGSVRDNGMLAEARGVKIKPKTEILSGNSVVFSAATGEETAYPYAEQQHGLFTYFLLKKLQETKGNTTYKELYDYIKSNVGKQSVVVNQKSQTPQIITANGVSDTWLNMKMK